MNQSVNIQKGERQSNLELLRLLAMLMILNLHSFWGYTHGSGMLQALDFFRECTSICAVNAFLIISGYFGIRWKLKSIFNLVFQIFFYAFAVYLVASLIGVVDFSYRGLLHNGKCLYSFWSFITYYLLMYICAPMMNAFSEKATSKQLLGFVIILVIAELFITKNYGFLNYCTMYLIGRCLRKNQGGVLENRRIKAGWGYWITTIMIFVIVYMSYKYLHIETAEAMQSVAWGLDYAAPLVILQAVFLVVWFARLEFQSKFVNWCAASTLSIFLIHMHPAIKYIGYYGYTESLYSLSTMEHVWKLALLMITVFCGSIIIDKVRIAISTSVYRIFEWIISKTKIQNTNILSYIPNIVKGE